MEKTTKKVKITSPIIVDGEHAEVGDVREVPIHTAHELIGAGTAEEHLEEGQERSERPTTVTTTGEGTQVQHRDPTTGQHGDPATHKRESEPAHKKK
jgi:hypothetical protein